MSRNLWLLTCAALSIGGCSLLLTDDSEQCSSNQDCTSRGAAFADTKCDLVRKVCVSTSVSTGGAAGTGGTAGAAGSTGNCTVNSQCTTQGAFVCIQGECRSFGSPECPTIIAQKSLKEANVRLFAMIAPLGGTTPEDFLAGKTVNAVNAMNEIYNGSEVNIVGLDPVSVVVCNEGADPKTVLDHLVSLEIRYIVGPQTTNGLYALLPLVKEREMALISPLVNALKIEEAGGEALTAVAEGNFVTLRPNRRRELDSYGPALEKARSILAAAIGGTQFDSIKAVALWNKNNPDSVAYKGELESRFPTWTFLEFGGVGTETALAAQVKAATPNFVVTASAEADWATVFQAIDTAYSGINDPPYYFVPGEAVEITDKIQTAEVSKRLFTLSVKRPSISDSVYLAFETQYKVTNQQTVPPPLTELAADAYLLTTYVSHAVKKPSTTPAAIRQAILDLARPVGPALSLLNFQSAGALVQFPSDQAADFHGASGSLDVDPVLGSPRESLSLRCYPAAGTKLCHTGFVFDATTGTPSGSADSACKCL